jgi:hypothetical protein
MRLFTFAHSSSLPFVACVLALPTFVLAADKPAKDGAEARAADLCNEMGDVKYAAQWAVGKVTLTARGSHNTGGYEVSLREHRIEIFPPQFSLVHKRPTGIVTQAITPFTASTSFVAAQKPKAVTVHDAKGAHSVPVE